MGFNNDGDGRKRGQDRYYFDDDDDDDDDDNHYAQPPRSRRSADRDLRGSRGSRQVPQNFEATEGLKENRDGRKRRRDRDGSEDDDDHHSKHRRQRRSPDRDLRDARRSRHRDLDADDKWGYRRREGSRRYQGDGQSFGRQASYREYPGHDPERNRGHSNVEAYNGYDGRNENGNGRYAPSNDQRLFRASERGRRGGNQDGDRTRRHGNTSRPPRGQNNRHGRSNYNSHSVEPRHPRRSGDGSGNGHRGGGAFQVDRSQNGRLPLGFMQAAYDGESNWRQEPAGEYVQGWVPEISNGQIDSIPTLGLDAPPPETWGGTEGQEDVMWGKPKSIESPTSSSLAGRANMLAIDDEGTDAAIASIDEERRGSAPGNIPSGHDLDKLKQDALASRQGRSSPNQDRPCDER